MISHPMKHKETNEPTNYEKLEAEETNSTWQNQQSKTPLQLIKMLVIKTLDVRSNA